MLDNIVEVIAHHQATNATYDIAIGMHTDEAIIKFSDTLKEVDGTKQERLEKESYLWFLNADLVVQAVQDLGQQNVANMLDIPQSALSSKLIMLKTHLRLYQPLIQCLSFIDLTYDEINVAELLVS